MSGAWAQLDCRQKGTKVHNPNMNFCVYLLTSNKWFRFLTPFLEQDDEQAGGDFEELRHDDSRGGEEAVARQRAHISDAEDERGILDDQDGQTDVLQLLVHLCLQGNKAKNSGSQSETALLMKVHMYGIKHFKQTYTIQNTKKINY